MKHHDGSRQAKITRARIWGVSILAAILIAALLIGGWAFVRQNTFSYTNLVDSESRAEARALLAEAGIEAEHIDRYFSILDQFYQVPYANIVESGYQTAIIPFFSYRDKDAFAHSEQLPDEFLNCRAAAFLLLGDKIGFERPPEGPQSIEEKDPQSRQYLAEDDLPYYDLLFAGLDDIPVHSSAEMAAALTEYWASAGIHFPQGWKANLLTAYGSDGRNTQNYHTAVVIQGSGEIWLLEKYNPLYPYQLSHFQAEDQLIRYMAGRVEPLKYAAVFSGDQCVWLK